MTKNTGKGRTMENIEFLISVGEFKLRLSLPKHTTVGGLVAVVRGYEALHIDYGPQGMPFLGLASLHTHPLLDYWLTQPALDFTNFKRRLELRCLYAFQRRGDKLYTGQFQFLVCLGKGACGEVYLVRSKVTGAIMALKRVTKATITNYQTLMTQFRQRKNLIKMGSNSHTVNLHACFESRSHFNFLMDYYPGGQLFLHLSGSQRQRMTAKHIKHYFCQIILAMEYIHKKKVLYRDLKPQNIFIDLQGHLRIGDFGMSKCDFEEEDFTTSICGSPQYMAPQVHEHQSYNFAADFYSIGAILYELLTGIPPYYNEIHENEDNRLFLMKNMKIDFAKATQDPHLQQLLANLLHPDPDYRISNFQEIKNSPWLAGVDWKSIELKCQLMPFAPEPTAPVETYIGRQFLSLEAEVSEINSTYEDEPFKSQISDAFEYIRPQSKRILGLESEISHLIKPKTKGSLKQKKEKYPKKANLSVALFDREETICESVCSQPRNAKGQNKENLGPLRRDHSKKVMVNLSKQASSVFMGKTGCQDHTPIARQKSQQRLFHAPLSNNSSQCSSRGSSELTSKIPSESSSKRVTTDHKKAPSRGRDICKNTSRDCKSKGRSKEKGLKESSLNKNTMMKKKEEKKLLPTCSFKIKLT